MQLFELTTVLVSVGLNVFLFVSWRTARKRLGKTRKLLFITIGRAVHALNKRGMKKDRALRLVAPEFAEGIAAQARSVANDPGPGDDAA